MVGEQNKEVKEIKIEHEIYITIERYCELKNICKRTFYNLKKQNKIPFKTITRKGFGKKHFLVVAPKDIVSIDKDNNILIYKNIY